MCENILKNLQCGNISLRPYVVKADETEWPLEYTVSFNEAVGNCTISATDGDVRDYLFLEYNGDEITCRRKFENNSDKVVSIKVLRPNGLHSIGHIICRKPRISLTRLGNHPLRQQPVKVVGQVGQEWNDMCIGALHHHKCSHYLRKVAQRGVAFPKKCISLWL